MRGFMTNYRVQRINTMDLDNGLLDWLRSISLKINNNFNSKFNPKNFDLFDYVKYNRFVVCYRNEKPVGIMMSRFYSSIFDSETKVLMQDLLYTEPETRAAKLLFDDFLDFGKKNANHVITMLTDKTNIKPSTLEKIGFNKLEVLYRMEIK